MTVEQLIDAIDWGQFHVGDRGIIRDCDGLCPIIHHIAQKHPERELDVSCNDHAEVYAEQELGMEWVDAEGLVYAADAYLPGGRFADIRTKMLHKIQEHTR